MATNYYYFNPFSKQYYFPKGFSKYGLFTNFYQAYTFKGRLLWNAWLKCSLLRSACFEKYPEKLLPLLNLQNYVPEKALLAFNRGTIGPEQKITVLGIDQDTGKKFFIKYAETKLARNNVNNEGNVLQQLKHLDFVPQLLELVNNEEFTLIKTNVLQGSRHISESVDIRIIEILKTLSAQSIEVLNKADKDLLTCFAHGDFCPWNMMTHQDKLWVFDWELAGLHPYGYDLFTYIFQTSFLLTPNRSNGDILGENKMWIQRYFNHFSITDIKDYLSCFVNEKLEFEMKKNMDSLLTKKYIQLQNDLPNLQL